MAKTPPHSSISKSNTSKQTTIFDIQRQEENGNQTHAQKMPRAFEGDLVSVDGHRLITLIPPRIFSLVRGSFRNTETTIEFLDVLEQLLLEKKKVLIDFSHIVKFTTDATLVLRSRLVSGSVVYANLPLDILMRNKLLACGFFGEAMDIEEVSDGAVKLPRGKIRNKESGAVRKDSQTKMLPQVANELVHFATKHLYGTERDYVWLQSILDECMLNTVQHASESTEREEMWWVSVYVDEEAKTARFNFLDNGAGILNRIRQRWSQKFSEPIPWKTDIELLKAALESGLGVSLKPGNEFGGTGLPHIYMVLKEGGIKNLVIISNQVIGRIKKNGYRTIKSRFSGSFLHWEIGLRQRKFSKNKCT